MTRGPSQESSVGGAAGRDEALDLAANEMYSSSLPYIKKTQKIYRGIVGRNRQACLDVAAAGAVAGAAADEVSRCAREADMFDAHLAAALELAPPTSATPAQAAQSVASMLDSTRAGLREVCEIVQRVEQMIDSVLEKRRADCGKGQ